VALPVHYRVLDMSNTPAPPQNRTFGRRYWRHGLALGLAVATGGAVWLSTRKSASEVSVPSTPATRSAARSAPIAWCAPGLEAIPGGGCFASAGEGSPLLVYLHGMYTPATAPEEMERQGRVAKRATAAGVSVLALRGEAGLCGPSLPDTFCWPSNAKNGGEATRIASAWDDAMGEAKDRGANGRSYLLGFSNGAYFAALIAVTSARYFDAVAVAHGGPGGAGNVAPRDAMVPMLLLSSDADPANGDMVRLQSALTAAHWPFASASTSGGHFLSNWDIDTALTFFARSQEKLPLTPPLAARSIAPAPAPAPTEPEPEAPSARGDAPVSE